MAHRVGAFYKGTLAKKSPHALRGYQDRFFVIDHRSRQLLYFLSEDHFNNGLIEKGSIQLEFIDVIALKDTEFIIEYSTPPPPPPPSGTSTQGLFHSSSSLTRDTQRTYNLRAPTSTIAEHWAIKLIQTKDLLSLDRIKLNIAPHIITAAMNAPPPPPPSEPSSTDAQPPYQSTPFINSTTNQFTSPRLQPSQQEKGRQVQGFQSQKSSIGQTPTRPSSAMVPSGSYNHIPSSSSYNHTGKEDSFDLDSNVGDLARSVTNLADYTENSIGMQLLHMELGVHAPKEVDMNRPLQYGTVQKLRPQKGLFNSFKNQWQSRYLVLTPLSLMYYSDEQSFQRNPKTAKNILHSHTLSDVKRVLDDKKEYKFQITHSLNGEAPRIYQFKVGEEYTLTEWIRGIQKVIDQSNDPTPTSKQTPNRSPFPASPSLSTTQQFNTPSYNTRPGTGAKDLVSNQSSVPAGSSRNLLAGTDDFQLPKLNNEAVSGDLDESEDGSRHYGWLTRRDLTSRLFKSDKKYFYVLTGTKLTAYNQIPPFLTPAGASTTIPLETIEEIPFSTVRNAIPAVSATGKIKEKIKDKGLDCGFILNTTFDPILFYADSPGDAHHWVDAFQRANTDRLHKQHSAANLIAGKMNKMLKQSKKTGQNNDLAHQTNTGERFREVDQLTFSVTSTYSRAPLDGSAIDLKGMKGKNIPKGSTIAVDQHSFQVQQLIQDTKSILDLGQARSLQSKDEHPNWFAVMYVYTAEQATALDVTRYKQRLALTKDSQGNQDPNGPQSNLKDNSKRQSAVPRTGGVQPSQYSQNDENNDDFNTNPSSIVSFDSSLHTNPAFSHFRTLYPLPPYTATPTGLGMGMYSEGGDRNKGGFDTSLQHTLAAKSLTLGRVSGEVCNIDGLYVEYWREVSRTEVRRPVYFEDLEPYLQSTSVQYSTQLFTNLSTAVSLITTPTIVPTSVNIASGLLPALAHANTNTPTTSPSNLNTPSLPGQNMNHYGSNLPGSTQQLSAALFNESERRGMHFEANSNFISMNGLSIQPPFIPLTTGTTYLQSNSKKCEEYLEQQLQSQLQQIIHQGFKHMGKPQHLSIPPPPTLSITPLSPSESFEILTLHAPDDLLSPSQLSPIISAMLPASPLNAQSTTASTNSSQQTQPQQNNNNSIIAPGAILALYKDANMDIPLQFQTIPATLLRAAQINAFTPKIISTSDCYSPFDPSVSPLTTSSALHFAESSYYSNAANNSAVPALTASASTINNVNWQLGPAQLSPYTLFGPKANRFSSLLTLCVPSKQVSQHLHKLQQQGDINKDTLFKTTGRDELIEILSALSNYLDSRSLRLSKYYDRHSAQAYQQWIDIKFAAQQLIKYTRSKLLEKQQQQQHQTNIGTPLSPNSKTSPSSQLNSYSHDSSPPPPPPLDDFTFSPRQRSSVMALPPPVSSGHHSVHALPSLSEDNTNKDGTCIVEEMLLLDSLPVQRRSSRAPSVLVTPFISSSMGLRRGHVSALTKKWEHPPNLPDLSRSKELLNSQVPLPSTIIAQARDVAAPSSFITENYNNVKALTRMHLERKVQRTSMSTQAPDGPSRRSTRVFQGVRLSSDGNLGSISEQRASPLETGEISLDELDRQINMSLGNDNDTGLPNSPPVDMPVVIDEGNEEDEDEETPSSLGPISGGIPSVCIPPPLGALANKSSALSLHDNQQLEQEFEEDDDDDDDDEDLGFDELELYEGWRFGSDPLLDRTLVKVCIYQTEHLDLYQHDLKNQRQVAEMTCTIGEILRNSQGILSRPTVFHFGQNQYQGNISVSFQHCLRTRIANTGRYLHGNFITRGSEYVPVTVDHTLDQTFTINPKNFFQNNSSGTNASLSRSLSPGTGTNNSGFSFDSNTLLAPVSAQFNDAQKVQPASGGEEQFWRPVSHMLPPIPTMQAYNVAGGQPLRTQEYDILCLETMQTSPHTFSVPAQVIRHARIQRQKETQLLREISECLMLELRTLEDYIKLDKEELKEFKKFGGLNIPLASLSGLNIPPVLSNGQYDLFTALQHPQLLSRAQGLLRRIVDRETAVSSLLPHSPLSSLEPFILSHSLIMAHNLYQNPSNHLNFTGIDHHIIASSAAQLGVMAATGQNPQLSPNQQPNDASRSSTNTPLVPTHTQHAVSLRNNLYSFHHHRLATLLSDKQLLNKRVDLIPTLQKQLKAKIMEYEKLIEFYTQVETIFDSYHGQYDSLFFKPSTTKVDEFLDFVGTNMHTQVLHFIKLPVNRPQLPLYHPPTELIPDLLAPAAQPLLHSSVLAHLNQSYHYNQLLFAQSMNQIQSTSSSSGVFSHRQSLALPNNTSTSDIQQLHNVLPLLLPNSLPTTLQEFVSYKLPYTYTNQLLNAVSSALHSYGLLSFLLSPQLLSESYSPFNAHTKGLLGYIPITVRMNECGTNVSLPMNDYGSNPTLNGNWRYPAISHLATTTAGALASHCDYDVYAGYWLDMFTTRIPALRVAISKLTHKMKRAHLKQQYSQNIDGLLDFNDIGNKKTVGTQMPLVQFLNMNAANTSMLSDFHLIQFERDAQREKSLLANTPTQVSSSLSLSQLTPVQQSAVVASATQIAFQKLYINQDFIAKVCKRTLKLIPPIANQLQQLEVQLFKFEQRKVPLISQALTSLATTFCSALVYHSSSQLLDVVNCGFLFPLQSYITAFNDEFSMLSDFEYAAQVLSHVKIKLVCKDTSTQSIEQYQERHMDSQQYQLLKSGGITATVSPSVAMASPSYASSTPKVSARGGKGNVFFNQNTTSSANNPAATNNVSTLTSQITSPYCTDLSTLGIIMDLDDTKSLSTSNLLNKTEDAKATALQAQIQPIVDNCLEQLQQLYPDLSTPSLLYTLLTKFKGSLGATTNTTGSNNDNCADTASNNTNQSHGDEKEHDDIDLDLIWNSLSHAARNLLNSQALYQNSRQLKANQWLSAMSISFSSTNAFDVTKLLATPQHPQSVSSRHDIFDNSIISSFISPLVSLGYSKLTPKFIPEHIRTILKQRNIYYTSVDLSTNRMLNRNAPNRGSSTPLGRHIRTPSDFFTKPFNLASGPVPTSSNQLMNSGGGLEHSQSSLGSMKLTFNADDSVSSSGLPSTPRGSTMNGPTFTAGDDMSSQGNTINNYDDDDDFLDLCEQCGFVTCICDVAGGAQDIVVATTDQPKPFFNEGEAETISSHSSSILSTTTELITMVDPTITVDDFDMRHHPSMGGRHDTATPPPPPELLLSTSIPPPPPPQKYFNPTAENVAPAVASQISQLPPSAPSLFNKQNNMKHQNNIRQHQLVRSGYAIDDTSFRSDDPYTIMTIHLPADLFYSLPPEVTGLQAAQANKDTTSNKDGNLSPNLTPKQGPPTPKSGKDIFKSVSASTNASSTPSTPSALPQSSIQQPNEVLIPVISLLFTQGVNEFTNSLASSYIASSATKRQSEINRRSSDLLIKYAMNFIQYLRYKPIFDRLLWAHAHSDCSCSGLGSGSSAASALTTVSSPVQKQQIQEEMNFWLNATCGRSDCHRSLIMRRYQNVQQQVQTQSLSSNSTSNTNNSDLSDTSSLFTKPSLMATSAAPTQIKHQTVEYGLDTPINIELLCNSSISSTTCYHCLRAMVETFSHNKLSKCTNNIAHSLKNFQYTSINAVNLYNQPVNAPARCTVEGASNTACPCLCSCHAFDICLCTPTAQCLSCSFAQICATNDAKICYIIHLVAELQTAMKQTQVRNLTIQTLATQLCRTMNGGEMLSCKSAKDRTSMAATWQTARQLHSLGVPQHQSLQLLEHLRAVGVRRANVIKNTGKTNYAFSALQRSFLPEILRPSPYTCSGKNVS